MPRKATTAVRIAVDFRWHNAERAENCFASETKFLQTKNNSK